MRLINNYYRTFLLALLCFLFSCAEKGVDNNLNGFWISTEAMMILEFKDDYVVFKPFNKEKELAPASVEKIDNNRFNLGTSDPSLSSSLTVDWKAGVIKLTHVSDPKTATFTRAPNVKIDDLLGTWYFYEKDADTGIETSEIVTQRVFSYDHDLIIIDHQAKEFSKIVDLNVNTVLKDGFIFTDEGDDSFSYYITDYTEDKITFIGYDNYQWYQYRKENPKHIDIPQGYVENNQL